MSGRRAAPTGKWQKRRPAFPPEQERMREHFVTHSHERLPRRFSAVERFNDGWPAKLARPGRHTLEVSSGRGGHLNSDPQIARKGHVALEGAHVNLASEILDARERGFGVGRCTHVAPAAAADLNGPRLRA